MVSNQNLPKTLENKFNDQFVKERLAYYYNAQNRADIFRDNMGRELIKQEIIDYGEDLRNRGCVFFMLSGSPPKGYALWVPGHQKLLIIDAGCEVKKKYTWASNNLPIQYVGDNDLDFEYNIEKNVYEKKS